MDCRTFHLNMEDYLEDGLDFSGRFAMERHASQCIPCGKEMAGATELRRRMLELRRVKAPSNFESLVLVEIGKRRSHCRFSGIRSLWIYGFELPSWQKLVLAFSGMAILGLGIFYAFHRVSPNPAPTPPWVSNESAKPAKMDAKTKDVPGTRQPAVVEAPKAAEAVSSPGSPGQEYLMDEEVTDTEYLEYRVVGPDNRPVTIRLPKYNQPSEEYFIRNVSH
jgi:hypothetical protein